MDEVDDLDIQVYAARRRGYTWIIARIARMHVKPTRVVIISAAVFVSSILVVCISLRAAGGARWIAAVGLIAAILMIVCYVVIHRFYAIAKGYSGELGLNMSLLPPFGFLILMPLKDRAHR